jgi:hypothetical protein
VKSMTDPVVHSQNAPTGFEEYYVDAPLTPAEHKEEKKIYDP